MSLLIAVPENIAQVRQMDDASPALPWSSFAAFFQSRISDQDLVKRPFLAYYDDDRQVFRTYSYAEFGTVVQRAATFLHDQVGLRRGTAWRRSCSTMTPLWCCILPRGYRASRSCRSTSRSRQTRSALSWSIRRPRQSAAGTVMLRK